MLTKYFTSGTIDMSDSFGLRHGHKLPKDMGLTTMDRDLRSCLWNAVLFTIQKMPSNSEYEYRGHADSMRLKVWTKFLKRPIDSMYGVTEDSNKFWHHVRQWYFDPARLWYETYEFLLTGR